jgi:hypothetical protein
MFEAKFEGMHLFQNDGWTKREAVQLADKLEENKPWRRPSGMYGSKPTSNGKL